MIVRWTPQAEQDREDIFSYIAAENPAAAVELDDGFGRSAALLADFPLMGRRGLIPGTRELVPHQNYRLVYEISDDTIWILALVHTARQWPSPRD